VESWARVSARLRICALLAVLGAAWPAARAQDEAPVEEGTSVEEGTLESATATRAGERVVRMGRRLVRRRTILRGSCFDYADRVFTRAGYPDSRRERAFSGAIEGPFADLSTLAPGDWLYIVTHPERDPPSTHSVIFLEWVDRAAGRASVLSYAGNNERRPGGIVSYDVSRTYRITRATGSPTWHRD
jgi:hypothetical protein